MDELITVIVPIYNVEKLLPRCIDSILTQTYKNLEIILINDGSPDKCGEICERYAKLDDRIKVIHKQNGGLSDARNAGIEIGQGKYITFVDSDDWIHQNYIEKLYDLLIKTNSEISVCNFFRTSTENAKLEITNGEILEFTNYEALEQLTDKFYIQMVIACGKLFKKDLFKNIYFPVGRVHEDEFTTYKLLFKASKVVLTTSQLYYYWKREDSIMGSGFNIRYKLDVIDALTERADFLKCIGLDISSGKTYKSAFSLYRLVHSRIKEPENISYKNELYAREKKLRKNLKESNLNFTFRLYYKLYFIFPGLVDIAYSVYDRLRKG